MRLRSRLSLSCVVLVVVACGRDPGPQAVAAASPAAARTPLQERYDRSCGSCHSLPGSGAPQRGDAQAWAPRLAQGADTLLDHTLNGYKAMPPLGACMDCDEAQFRALIGYLAGAEAMP
mgnify:CR=1 FL=1